MVTYQKPDVGFCQSADTSLVLTVSDFVVDSYRWLVNGTARTQVDTFFKEEHSFEDYTKVRNDDFSYQKILFPYA